MKSYQMNVMSLFRFCVAVSAAVCARAAFAADVYLSTNDTTAVRSFSAAGNWDSRTAPEPGNDYFTAGYVLMDPAAGAAISFRGDSLTLDHEFWHVNSGETTVSNMIVTAGGFVYTVNTKGPLLGRMTLQSDVSFMWRDAGHDSISGPNQLNMDIVGDATTSVYFNKSSKEAKRINKSLSLGGDLSAFYGTIYSHLPTTTVQVVFSAGKTSFPGKLEGTNGATVKINVADGVAATIGSIDAADVLVTLGDGATLTVSGAVDLHGNKIRVASAHVWTAAAESLSLLTFDSASLTAADVVLEDVVAAQETGLDHCPKALNLQLSFVGKTLTASHRRIVWLQTGDMLKSTSIFTGPGESRWSEQLDATTAADTDYYLTKKQACHPLTSPVTFYGKSLTIAGGTSGKDIVTGSLLASAQATLTIDDFRWSANGGSSVQISNYGSGMTLNGNITVLPAAKDVFFGFNQWNDRTATINSAIRGSGGVKLTCNQEASNNAKANFELTGDNSAFTGRLLIMHEPFKSGTTPAGDPENHFVMVKVAGQQNLGGALPAFDAESLSIEDNSLLQVTQSAVFDEPTRGWRVRGHGRIGVPADVVVTVTNKTVTYAADGADAGRFTKEGAGTLVLGGEAAAEAGSSLEVKEGMLRLASTNAVAGLSVSFAADTALQVDLSATGAFAEKGAVNMSATPFSSAASDEKIPLTLMAAGTIPDGEFDVAICTVSDALKDTLAFDCPLKFGRHRTSVRTADNGDGTVTFFVQAEKSGMILLVR